MRAIERLPIFNSLRRRLAALGPDTRGATLVEFGLLFPVLALLVMATIDVSRGLGAKFRLEQAAHRTIEMATVGGVNNIDEDVLEAEAALAAGVPVENADVRRWIECDAVRDTTNDDWTDSCESDQQTSRYVEVTIFADYMPSFRSIPLMSGFGNQPDGSVRLWADAGVRVQ